LLQLIIAEDGGRLLGDVRRFDVGHRRRLDLAFLHKPLAEGPAGAIPRVGGVRFVALQLIGQEGLNVFPRDVGHVGRHALPGQVFTKALHAADIEPDRIWALVLG
jgi:hypothetical protein